VGVDILEGLKRRGAQAIPGDGWTVHYALFSRSGFTSGLHCRAEEERVMLVPLEKIVA